MHNQNNILGSPRVLGLGRKELKPNEETGISKQKHHKEMDISKFSRNSSGGWEAIYIGSFAECNPRVREIFDAKKNDTSKKTPRKP